MWKTVYLVCFLCLFGLVAADDEAILSGFFHKCPRTKTLCEVTASFYYFSDARFGSSKCMTEVEANCEAEAIAESCLSVATLKRLNECDIDFFRETAECIATATSYAFAETLVRSQCEGSGGYSCGVAEANAYSLACAVSASFVKILVDTNTLSPGVDCDVSLLAVVQALVEASASSFSEACSFGDGVLRSDSGFEAALGIQDALTQAVGTCFSFCTPFFSFSSVTGSTEGSIENFGSKTESASLFFGDGSGDMKDDPPLP